MHKQIENGAFTPSSQYHRLKMDSEPVLGLSTQLMLCMCYAHNRMA